MNKTKKIILTLKVFVPILVKGLLNLWQEIMEAYEENNVKQLNLMGELSEKYMREK